MSQEIKYVNIKELVLWTENPRDPINPEATDQEVVNKALLDKNAKWSLNKLAKEMGGYYDFSELPTVVYKDGRPIVYDGNRRIILAKIKYNLVSIGEHKINVPDVPQEIPCNVCSEEVALQNVYRKHADSGSWDPLERDIFLNKYMRHEKTPFLLFEENTNGFISSNPSMNKGFVKDEILNERGLNELGFTFDGEQLLTRHSNEELHVILKDLLNKIDTKQLSTRANRGNVVGVLDTRTRTILDKNKDRGYRQVEDFDARIINIEPKNPPVVTPRRTRRVDSSKPELFGGRLYLKAGDINNLYMDICAIYDYYETNKSKFSSSFSSIIRMSLRLLCESAMKDIGKSRIDEYIAEYFANAKKTLSQDTKTLLANLNVSASTLPQLLHTGAHDYSASRLYDQTIGISIILGAMLAISHGKAN
jgi:hypothetical protein